MAQDGNNGVDLVNEARKRDFKKALSQVPRYTGDYGDYGKWSLLYG